MKSLQTVFLLLLASFSSTKAIAQVDTCINAFQKHDITSSFLEETREFWVSLPMDYDTTLSYPVIYLFDAEWRFDLIRTIAYDLAGNRKIPHHIIVGIPHINWRNQRGIDLTFSHSNIEYDGKKVDSTIYNASNSGGGEAYYEYLTKELVRQVDSLYPTNGQNILIGHSYGGYFNSFILGRDHPFTAFQIYDPSLWYNDGEAINQIHTNLSPTKELDIFISYQPVPEFHSGKIKELIGVLAANENLRFAFKRYENETHNSLFMISFLDGMQHLYANFKPQ